MYIQFGASAKGVVMLFFFSLFITKFRCIKNTNWFCSHLWNLATKGRGNCIKMQKVCARFVCLSLTHSISLSLSLADIHAMLRSRSHSDAHRRTHTRTNNSPFHRAIRSLFLLPFLSLYLSIFPFLSQSVLSLFTHTTILYINSYTNS